MYMQRQQYALFPSCSFLRFRPGLTCDRIAYSQCRTQDPATGSWSGDRSWQCQAPGQSPTGGTVPSTGGSTAQPNAASTDSNTGIGNGQAQQSAAHEFAATNPIACSNGDTTTPATSINGTQPATKGDCGSTRAPSGWDGVASTSVSHSSYNL